MVPAAFPQWTTDLLTGDRELDTHHRALFVKAQRLAVACSLGRGGEGIEVELDWLRTYAQQHFAAEDDRMTRFHYPYVETHRAAHRSFTARLAGLEADLRTGADRGVVAAAAAAFVTDWFVTHVRLVDMPLIEHLRRRC